jgi:polar amino acid transport system substrate-binding protein
METVGYMNKLKNGLFFYFLMMFFIGCSTFYQQKKVCTIGVDPSWFPLVLEGKEKYVVGFFNEFLEEMSKRTQIEFIKLNMSWDNTIEGLKLGKYQAILSSIPLTIENQKLFSFSDEIVLTGARVVIPMESNLKSLDEIKDGFIGCVPYTKEDLYVQAKTNLFPHYYETTVKILQGVEMGEIQAGVIYGIPAISYVQDLYGEQLKLLPDRIDSDSIRFITKKDQQKELLKEFNEALKEFKKTKQYQALLKKWMLN